MNKQARLGLLVIAGVVMFMLALFAVASRTFLFSGTFQVNAKFDQVAGLRAGAPVSYHGISVGRVESVRLPMELGDRITVSMAIRQNAAHLVRRDTQAQIKTDGLMGNQIVVLIAGSETAPHVQEGEFITGIDPVDLFEITDNIVGTVSKFDTAAVMLYEIMSDVRAGEGTLGKFVYDPAAYESFVRVTGEAERLMRTLDQEAHLLVEIAGRASEGINSIIHKIDEGEGTLSMMLNDPGMYNALLSASANMEAMATDLAVIMDRAEDASNWGALAMYRLAENMEALRHNWFFRRYFEERGYVERAPFETRERALQETHEQLETYRLELMEWEQRLRLLEARLNDEAADAAEAAVISGSEETTRQENN